MQAWNTERPPLPPNRRADSSRDVQPFGAVAWLSQETHIKRDTIDKLLAGKLARMGLGHADALLNAIGRPEALWNDEVPVQGNPNGGLKFAHARVHKRIAYSATIQLAGHNIGRVRRYESAARYLAYDDAGVIVADAASVAGLRRELLRRNFTDAYCCGGSMTGDATPRPGPTTLLGTL